MDYRDFRLAEGIEDFLARCDSLRPPDAKELTVAEQRACYDAVCRLFDAGRPPGVQVEALSASGGTLPVPLRLYRPAEAGPLPVVLYCHGGGWVLGGLDSHDSIAAELAAEAGCAVVAVDYRLAPEHPWPAQLDDAWAALGWLVEQAEALGLDRGRIAVAGDSAGGQLAAALALKARAAGGPSLAAQVLIYPALGLEFAEPERSPAPDGPGLTRADMAAYWHSLFGGRSVRDPLAHPLLQADLAGLPPALIVAAEFDPLRNDAAVYGARLAAAGVPVEQRCFEGLVHGCLRARHLSPQAGRLFALVVEAVVRLLATGKTATDGCRSVTLAG